MYKLTTSQKNTLVIFLKYGVGQAFYLGILRRYQSIDASW
jgi:hypothetical protein